METLTRLFNKYFVVVYMILAIILMISIPRGESATCTSVSRTNASANSVLTSTRYNADLNTIYGAANALDGGCITDATLEATALNATDFTTLLNGITQGCKVTRTDANTLSVDRCIASVNGYFIKTTSATTVTWGCSGCSAESSATNTVYYLYIATGSTGSTLTLKILTGAPNADGYDSNGNRVLARFINNVANDIPAVSVENYNRFGTMDNIARVAGTSVVAPMWFFVNVNCDASSLLSGTAFLSGTPSIGNVAAGICTLTVPADNFANISRVVIIPGIENTAGDEVISIIYTSVTSIGIKCVTTGGGACTAFNTRIAFIEGLN